MLLVANVIPLGFHEAYGENVGRLNVIPSQQNRCEHVR